MKCIKCNCSDKMLYRTEPLGSNNPNWMCMPCIEKHESELANNIKRDDDMKLLNTIETEVKKWR